MKQRVAKAQVQEIAPPSGQKPAETDLQRWIAEAAYFRAQNRGFEPGGETDDWLAAEAEVLARLRGGAGLM